MIVGVPFWIEQTDNCPVELTDALAKRKSLHDGLAGMLLEPNSTRHRLVHSERCSIQRTLCLEDESIPEQLVNSRRSSLVR